MISTDDRRRRTSWKDCSFEYKCFFGYHVCVMVLFAAGGGRRATRARNSEQGIGRGASRVSGLVSRISQLNNSQITATKNATYSIVDYQ
jgi:hypothetical protein